MGESWITLTVTGTRVGVIAAAFAYTAASHASSAVATGSGMSLSAIGELAGMGASYIWGSAAGTAVRIFSHSASKTTEASLRHSGMLAAGGVALATGAATALTITVGTRVIEYSIEYGGKISKETAHRLSELYLQYRATQSDFSTSGDPDTLVENDWILIAPDLNTEK